MLMSNNQVKPVQNSGRADNFESFLAFEAFNNYVDKKRGRGPLNVHVDKNLAISKVFHPIVHFNGW